MAKTTRKLHYLGVEATIVLKAINAFINLGYNHRDIPEYFPIDVETWVELKKMFNVRKYTRISNVLLREMQATYGKKKLEEILDEVIETSVGEDISGNFDKKLDREYGKKISQATDLALFQSKLEEFIENRTSKALKVSKGVKVKKHPTNNDNLIVHVSDIHFGKDGHEKVVERFNYVLEYILTQPEKHITFIFTGDLNETLMLDGMHYGQVAGMDLNGLELAEEVERILVQFHLDIVESGKTIESYFLAGNHDREIKEHKLYYKSFYRVALLKIVKARLSSIKQVDFNILGEVWNVFETGGFNFICIHGDDGTMQKDKKDIYIQHGRTDIHNLLLRGHFHFAEYYDINKNFSMVGAGALAGTSDYSANGLYSSMPSFNVIRKNKFGLPDIEVKKIGI